MMTTNPMRSPTIRQQALDIQSSWSNEEREERAKEGQRRRQELFSLLSFPLEPEIWAVGAPTIEDSSRIAS